MDVKISYSTLEYLHTSLTRIIDEFESASVRRGDLASDIGNPYDHSQLRDKTNEFESRWDDRRSNLLESCKAVAEHAQGVMDGFEKFDVEAAGTGDGGNASRAV